MLRRWLSHCAAFDVHRLELFGSKWFAGRMHGSARYVAALTPLRRVATEIIPTITPGTTPEARTRTARGVLGSFLSRRTNASATKPCHLAAIASLTVAIGGESGKTPSRTGALGISRERRCPVGGGNRASPITTIVDVSP